MSKQSGRILVVDDSEIIREMLSEQLKWQGHDVTLASDGREALTQVANHVFDVILLDIMMPIMNGYQVLTELKGSDQFRHIPVIVISAVQEFDSVVRCIELGAEDYLFKPINKIMLRSRIQASLEKKHWHDQEQAHIAEMAAMQALDRDLNTTLDLNHALKLTLNWALRRSGAQAGMGGVIDGRDFHVLVREGGDDDIGIPARLPLAYFPVLSTAINTRRIQFHNASTADGDVNQQVAVPICRDQQVIAMLLLESPDYHATTPDSLGFLDRLREHAAIALANARLYAAVQAANVAKSEFVSLVSHELKTPMSVIKAYSELLTGENVGELNEKQASFVSRISFNIARMMDLVGDLGDISRVEAGQLSMDMGIVPIEDVIEEVVQSLQRTIDDRDQTLTLSVPERLPATWGDHLRLVQVVTNLLSNASKYTPDGGKLGIEVAVSDNVWDPEGCAQVVHFAVTDKGRGIPVAEHHLVFHKFFRSEDVQLDDIPGTGLGLSITKYLVEMQGGRIWFESEPGKGSTFHFTVPTAATAADAAPFLAHTESA